MLSGSNTFSKQERLCSSTQIDRLFSEGNRQISVFPVRLVWLLTDDIKGIQVLISAPKRNFHHAVDRNRIKRQIREFYRTGSSSLKETVALKGKGLALAFLSMTISYGSQINLTSVFPRRWKNWLKHCPRCEEIVEYFYQIVGVVADASHTVLP